MQLDDNNFGLALLHKLRLINQRCISICKKQIYPYPVCTLMHCWLISLIYAAVPEEKYRTICIFREPYLIHFTSFLFEFLLSPLLQHFRALSMTMYVYIKNYYIGDVFELVFEDEGLATCEVLCVKVVPMNPLEDPSNDEDPVEI